MRWEDSDVSRGVILLRQTKSGQPGEVVTKSVVDRALNPLPGDDDHPLPCPRRRPIAARSLRRPRCTALWIAGGRVQHMLST